MSHITDTQVRVKDLDSVKAACLTLGLTYAENTKAKYFYGKSKDVFDLTVAITPRYDLAFLRQEDGTYSMSCDDLVSKKLINNFKQNYDAEVIKKQALKKKNRVESYVDKDGWLVVTEYVKERI